MATIDDTRLAAEQPMPVSEGDAAAPLRAYVAVKQSIAQLLREIRQLAESAAPSVTERVHDVTVRLAEDRFQLVVVGQFKRGKTSLMNAIIGRALLPTGSIPVTSAVTSLRYGSALRAVIRRAGQGLDQEVPIGALPDFVTERGNPGNKKQVLSADVEVPAAFLRRGLHFVDTPGIGSAREQNTATTLAFLPEADAAIFVTGADAPLSEGELEFLDAVHQHVRKLFFVLNKIDQIGTTDRAEVLAYTSQLLAQRLGVEAIRLFAVSAARALAKDANDPEALAASGLPAFESALATFLNDDRQRTFLVAVLDRTVKLLEEMQFTVTLRQRATAQSPDKDQKKAELSRRYEEQDQQRHAVIDRATELVSNWRSQVLDPALDRFAADAREALSGEVTSASQSWPADQPVDRGSRVWLHTQLERSAQQFLQSLIEPIADVTRRIAEDLRGDLVAILERTLATAGSVFGLVIPHDDAAPGQGHFDRWRWTPPTFEPPFVVPDLAAWADDLPRMPIPHALAARLAARRITQRLPQEISRVTNLLRDIVIGHLHACVDDLDSVSARALTEERRRVGLALDSHEQAERTVRVPVGDASAVLQSLLGRVTAVREALLRQAPVEQVLAEAEPKAATEERPESEATLPETSQMEPKRRIVTGTCAICAAVSDALFDFLCHQQYAIVVDRSTQRQFMASHGLCPTHTWHLERIASPRGLSASYPALLEETAARLQAMTGHPARSVIAGIHELRSSTDQCPACLACRKAERAGLQRLAGQLQTPEGRATFQHSQWLCLSHLQLLLAAVDDEIVRDLLRTQARRLQELAESMREYVLKLDARRRNLLTAEESRAYQQALVSLVGERYLVVTVPEE
jgi:hypothetical protein